MTGTLKLLSSPSLLRSASPLCWPCEPTLPLWGLPGCPSWGVKAAWMRGGGRNQFSVAGGSNTAYLWLVSPLSHRVTFFSLRISMAGDPLYSLIPHSPIVWCLWGVCSRTATAPALVIYLLYGLINVK